MVKSQVGDGLLCLTAAGLLLAGFLAGQVLLYFPAMALLLWRTHLRLRAGKDLLPGTLILVLVAFCLPPDLSDDYHRYLWEGFVQNQGYSPYRHSPESLYPVLDHPSEGKVNNAGLTAIYPPLTQYLFRLVDGFFPSIYGWKILILMVLLLYLYIYGARSSIVIGLPLVLVEGLWNAHVDLLGLLPGFFLVDALKSKKPLRAGLALAILIGVKIIPIIFFPLCFLAFNRRQWLRFCLAVVVPLLLLYLPYLDQGQALFSSFIQFSRAWYFNNPFFHLLGLMVDPDHSRLILSLGLGLSLILIFFKQRDPLWKLVIAWLAVIVFSPTVHPWYLLWLIPLVPRQALVQLNLAYGAMFLSYLVLVPYRAEGIWRENPWWMAAEWSLLLYFFYKMQETGQLAGDERTPEPVP